MGRDRPISGARAREGFAAAAASDAWRLRRWPALVLAGVCALAAVLLVAALPSSSPPPRAAAPQLASDARASGFGDPAMRSVEALRPDPVDAPTDKGVLFDDGCVLLHEETDSPECAYGNPDSETTVVVFGDSHALQWFPPLLELAERRDWRLVGLVRAGCVVGQVAYERPCNVWRRKAMRRIVHRERPQLVVVSTSTGGRYQVFAGGERLDRRASQPLLVAGFARTLRRLKRSGAEVVVIRDQQLAPFDPPECVSQNRDDPSRCVFYSRRRRSRAFDAFGAARARVRLVDPNGVLCPRRRCPTVMGELLVYRDTYHMSATFARTLAPWLRPRLPLPLADG